jgi:hypothetical protein
MEIEWSEGRGASELGVLSCGRRSKPAGSEVGGKQKYGCFGEVGGAPRMDWFGGKA